MSRILAVDTSSNACSVALSWGNQLCARYALTPRGHMQRLLPMIDEVLSEAGCTVAQLAAIAFGRGPGSFTGLRVVTGVVQGLAYGADLPVIPVSSLACLAQGYARRHPKFNGSLGVAVDARMDEAYIARFQVDSGRVNAMSEESLVPIANVAAALTGVDAACGSAWQLELLLPHAPTNCLAELEPDAQDILTLAQADGATRLTAAQAQPVYLRDSVSWQKRTRIRTDNLE